MIFEWDSNKAEQNIKNHGVSFIEAENVFFDEFALDVFDDAHSDFAEQRFNILGMTQTKLLLVVYTVKYDEIYRIISARKATKPEENAY